MLYIISAPCLSGTSGSGHKRLRCLSIAVLKQHLDKRGFKRSLNIYFMLCVTIRLYDIIITRSRLFKESTVR